MTSARSFLAKWLVTSLVPLAATSTPQVFAQGGFGPDPYRPFSQQYDAFVYPIAPGQGDVLPNEAAMSRAGMARSNQFQNYMRGLGETGGTYRSQRRLDPKAFREQQYQPNRKVDEQSGYYEKQDIVSQAYFAYIRERDPKKRAELLKEYQKARSKPARSFVPSEARRSAKKENGLDAEGRSATASRLEKPAAARTRGAGTDAAEPSLKDSSAAPEASGPRDSTKPSDILERSLKRDRIRSLNPGGGSPGTSASPRGRAPGRIPPPPSRHAPSTIPGLD